MPSASSFQPLPDPAPWRQLRQALLDDDPATGVRTIRLAAGVWRWRETASLERLQELLARHDQALAAGRTLGQGLQGSVTAVSHNGSRTIVKEFRPCRPGWLSPARRAWLASFQLAELTPPCLGWLRESKRELLFFADAGNSSFADDDLAGRPDAEAAYAEAGRVLARLHQRGILHRDGRPCHFLLQESADSLRVSIIGGEHLHDCGRPLSPAERLAGVCLFMAASDGIRAWAVRQRCLGAWLQGYHAVACPEGQSGALAAFQTQVAGALLRTSPPPGHNLTFAPWAPEMSPLANLPRGGECVGCGNCVAACRHQVLALQHDLCGFQVRHTVAAEACRSCGRCLAVCPQLAVCPLAQPLPAPSCYAGRHHDPDVIRRSSSGGAFAALAETFLLRDGAALYGVAMAANRTCYIRLSGNDGLAPLHGSKYLPSSIAAMKLHLRQQNIPTERLLLVDLVCHGVPAPRFFEREIARLAPGTEVISFRGKTAPRDSYNLLCRLPDGSLSRRPALTSPSYQGFAAKITLRDSCYHCRYARVPREGDLSLGDFIGHPDLNGDAADGLSLVLANSRQGLALLRESGQRLLLQPATLASAAPGNPRLCNGSHPYEHHPLRRFLPRALDRWPWWLLTLLYGGGYRRRVLGKLPFKLLYHFGKEDYRRTANPRLRRFLRSPAANAPASTLNKDS